MILSHRFVRIKSVHRPTSNGTANSCSERKQFCKPTSRSSAFSHLFRLNTESCHPMHRFSTKASPKSETTTFANVKPSEVPEAIVFEHKYRPLRYPFWNPWMARFALWSVMRKYPGSSVAEITEGALQAFKAIYPILNPSSAQPLPSPAELEKMMEPPIIKQLVKHREHPETLQMEIALVKVKKIVLADCKMGLLFRKDANPVDAHKSWEAKALAPRFITPVFVITTEEEVKSVCGVAQRSRTRFFELDHIYGFRTLLPPMAHQKTLSVAECLEKTPIHWRVAMLRSDYGSVFSQPQKEGQTKSKEENKFSPPQK